MALSEAEELEYLRMKKRKHEVSLSKDTAQADMAAEYAPTVGMSGTDKFLAGAGKAVSDLYSGGKQILGMESQENIAETEKRDAALMATGAGKAGNIAGNVAAAVPAAFVPGANTIVGAGVTGAVLGALQPVGEGDVAAGKLKNAAIGGATGAASQAIIGKAGEIITKKMAANAATKTENAVRDATLKAGKDAGYVVPPSQANPTVTNKALEGFAGKLTTAQKSSTKNQEVTNRLAREALGLTDDAPLTKETLATVREGAGKAYEAVKQTGTFKADNTYLDTVAKLSNLNSKLKAKFPSMANKELETLADDLFTSEIDADVAVEALKQLRFDGNANKLAQDPAKQALGRVQRRAADAVEGLMERELAARGDTATLNAFKEARTLIAKSYSVESALNPATGNVSAQKLGNQLKRGKPLSGSLKTAGEMGQAFPKAVQEMTSSTPGVSPLDYAAAGIASAASGKPGILGAIVGRPVVRGAILSKPYQAAMTNQSYDPASLRLADLLQKSPIGQAGLRGLLPASIYATQE